MALNGLWFWFGQWVAALGTPQRVPVAATAVSSARRPRHRPAASLPASMPLQPAASSASDLRSLETTSSALASSPTAQSPARPRPPARPVRAHVRPRCRGSPLASLAWGCPLPGPPREGGRQKMHPCAHCWHRLVMLGGCQGCWGDSIVWVLQAGCGSPQPGLYPAARILDVQSSLHEPAAACAHLLRLRPHRAARRPHPAV